MATLFHNDELYLREYHDFNSIMGISFYILDDKDILFDNINLINDMLESFFKVINAKWSVGKEEYGEFYENFLLYLDKCQDKFYTEIYEPSDYYDENALKEIMYHTLNENNEQSYIIKIRESFKKLLELFKEFSNENISNLSKKYNNLDVLISETKESFEDLNDLFDGMDNYKKEYHDFRSIKRIAFSLLNNKSNLSENVYIIDEMLILFSSIVESKSVLSQKEYDLEYEKFSLKLLDCKKKYYMDVFNSSEKHGSDEFLSKVINSFFKEE